MGLSVGIVGLPNVGKSTIFNALTAAGAQSANYPFCTIEPNVGIVPVVDARLDKLAELAQSKQTVYTDLKVVDIAGLVRGACKGRGSATSSSPTSARPTPSCTSSAASTIRTSCTSKARVDPERDIEVIETELLLADLDAVGKKLDRVGRLARVGQKEYVAQAEALEKAKAAADKGTPLRAVEFTDEERESLRELNLITLKPVLYVANVAEIRPRQRDAAAAEGARDRRGEKRARSSSSAASSKRRSRSFRPPSAPTF